jgi:poly-beta-1,6-N-acetyl-D-glucosamine N-deacetylase
MIARVGNAAGRAFGIMLLPLSILPIVLLTPQIAHAPEIYMRKHVLPAFRGPPPVDRSALVAPNVGLSAAQKARFVPFATHETVPVLAYSRVSDRHDPASLTQESLALQLQMLARAGFQTISTAQYVRFLHGGHRGLPGRPLLLTFDARIDTWRAADRLLERYGMRATMFVPAAQVQQANPQYLSWREIRAAVATGRWDIQEAAGQGDLQVVTSAEGDRGPFYANKRFAQGQMETLAGWRRRVTSDIYWGRRTIAANVPGHRPRAFALPEGDYGRIFTNDRRIPARLASFLSKHFGAAFALDPPAYVAAGSSDRPAGRFEVHASTTPERLYARLRAAAPEKGR